MQEILHVIGASIMDFNVDDLISAGGKKLRDDFNYIVQSNPHYEEKGGQSVNKQNWKK